jgi:alkylhydroperoxidase/carboxymuconolactone decarboxylase family protein YurZ
MKRERTPFLALVFVVMFNFAATSEAQDMDKNQSLSTIQKSIIPIAAFTANGDMDKLRTALNEGLDAGLTVNEIKEILVQMYAYVGFPNAWDAVTYHVFVRSGQEV